MEIGIDLLDSICTLDQQSSVTSSSIRRALVANNRTLLEKVIDQAVVQGVVSIVLDRFLDSPSTDLPIANRGARRLAGMIREHTEMRLDYDLIANSQTPSAFRTAIAHIQAEYAGEFKETTNILRDASDQWCVIKGMAVASHYRHPHLRDNWDIDIYYWNFVEAMKGALAIVKSGGKVADCKLSCVGRDQYSWKLHLLTARGALVELHVGPLAGYADVIVESELPNRLVAADQDGIAYAIPSVTDQLLYLLIHSYQEGVLSRKDVNDGHYLLNSPNLDIEYLASCACHNHLTPVLHELLRRVGLNYASDQPRLAYVASRIPFAYCDSLLGRCFGRERVKISRSFQPWAFPAQFVYLLKTHRRSGFGLLKRVLGRFSFGLERATFPERDARKSTIPNQTLDMHRIAFPFRSYQAQPFWSLYWGVIPCSPHVHGRAKQVWSHTQGGDSATPTAWKLSFITAPLLLAEHPDFPPLLVSPVGFLGVLDYYRSFHHDETRLVEACEDIVRNLDCGPNLE